MTRTQIFLTGAWQTVSRLFGGLMIGLLLGTVVFHLIPGSSVDNPSPVHASIAAFPALIGFLAGGAAWGVALGRHAPNPDGRKAAFSGVLGFGPISFLMVVGLGMLEPKIVEWVGPGIPIHRLFTILFTTSALLITGISVMVAVRMIGFNRSPIQLGLRAALAAAGAFLAVNLAMEASGWVVGAPGAGSRATMLVVMFFGNLAAAVAAGGLLALDLAPQAQAAQEIARAAV